MTITEWWQGQNTSRRAVFGVGLAAILIGAAVTGFLVWPKSYIPLFVDLQPHDSATLVAQLETLNANYRVDEATGVITVPEKQRDRLRMTLLERGVPFKSALGFELFDNAGFGATEFSQKINYQRALEGELARTIMSLDPVRYARLHLVLPESSLFKRDREQPKASVTIITDPARSLTPEQIVGVQRLVASAVPGLTQETVSVHDHHGVELSSSGAGGSGGTDAVRNRLRAKETVESYLTAKVYEILAPIYSPKAIAVSIDATLRMDHVTSTLETVAAADQRAGQSGTKKIDQIDELPGAIERLSVGVMLPSGPLDIPLVEIRDLISSAVGADVTRGDTIAVFPALKPAVGNGEGFKGTGLGLGLDSTLRNAPVSPSRVGEPEKVDSPPDVFLLAMFVLVLLGILVWAIGARGDRRMSRAEREALLGNVRDWLQDDHRASRPSQP